MRTTVLSRMRPSRWALLVAAALFGVLTLTYYAASDYVRAAAFIVEAGGVEGVARRLAGWQTAAFREQDLDVPSRHGPLRARLYRAVAPRGAPVLLTPGVHATGIDEPRLVRFAADLAAVGHSVLTVGLPDLARYEITPRSTDMIEDAAAWLADHRDLARDRRVTIIGISFSGGLSIVATGRESLRERVGAVLSFGGHGDLGRTLRYLCTGVEPDGSHRPPHDYGVAIILLGAADLVVPGPQVAPLREAIRTFLEASHVDMVDRTRAAEIFGLARDMAGRLPEPARTLMGYVNDRDVAALGPILLPHIGELADDDTLSPVRAPAPAAPIYLLHGADDNVIPASESEQLAETLRQRGARVQQLTTGLITHAELERPPTPGEAWRLLRFWAGLLSR